MGGIKLRIRKLGLKYYLFVILWLAFTVIGRPALAVTLDIDDEFSHVSLSGVLEYFVEDKETLTITEAVQNKGWTKLSQDKLSQDKLSVGFSSSTRWFKFQLENSSALPQEIIIEINQPNLDKVDFYLLDSRGILLGKETMGDKIPASSRSMPHAHLLYPISLDASQQVAVVVRVDSSFSIKLPLTVWKRTAFIAHDFQRTVWLTMFFGTLLILGVYHFMVAVFIRDITVVYYSVFMFSILMIFLLQEGVGALLFWPNTPGANHYFNVAALSLAGASHCLFSAKILLLSRELPTLDRLLKCMAVIALLPVLAMFFIRYSTAMGLSVALSILVFGIYCIALIRRTLDGYPPTAYLIAATLCAIFGIGAGLLIAIGGVSSSGLMQAVSFGGIALMSLFYALSISYRVNMDRKLRQEIQIKLTHELDELVRERTEELETVNEKLRIVSITDGLTAIYNRRHFDNCLEIEYNRAYREKSRITVLLLDLDHFKNLNDTFGHSFGDLCLQAAARVIKKTVQRPTDVVARYGGEEFVVLLPETDLQGAVYIAWAINKEISCQTIVDGDLETQIAVSIGVASCIPEKKNEQKVLVKEADEWLYKAKENGRNRVEYRGANELS